MDPNRTANHRPGHFAAALAVLVGVVAVGLFTIESSRTAFSDTTSNGVNNLAAGTVVISDDDTGTVMVNLAGMVPGDTVDRCINVTYSGTVTADVKLYGAVAGTGLDAYLDMNVDIGTGAAGGASFSCVGLTGTTPLQAGVLTLADFGANNVDFASGLGGFAGATNPTTRSYHFVFTLLDDNNAQGLDTSATFTWEAQNV